MGQDLLSPAAGLFKGAADTQQGISEIAMKERVAADDRRSKASTDLITTGINNYAANKRQEVSEAGATQREGMQQEGANKRQQMSDEAQFITLTPQLKKGAAEVTNDKSWNDIPDNFKMRADVYSSLLAAQTKMADIHKPQMLEIQEGDKVYTAEYDPVTRKLTKKSAGGDKWSPDQRDGKKGSGAQLNPFTLQNIVRQDEKTLLTQMGGKGKKGIPEQGDFGKLMSKVTGGRIGELSPEENAKLGTLRSLAQRMKNNYQNLADLEESRGLSPTQPDQTALDTIDALLGKGAEQPAAAPQGASGTKIKVIAPDGTPGYIGADKLTEALKRGFKRG